jgi:hypothetical protein
MNELIESGDPRSKVVGKRRIPAPATSASIARFDQLQQMVGKLMSGLPYPKGVHRFHTEEEFDLWKTTLMIQNSPGRRSPMTSSPSAAS